MESRFEGSPTLGGPRASRVFVTPAEDIQGITSSEGLAQRLTLLDENGELVQGPFSVTEFDTPEGIGNPILRDNPGFVEGGYTAGGAREFDIPNLNRSELSNPFTYGVS